MNKTVFAILSGGLILAVCFFSLSSGQGMGRPGWPGTAIAQEQGTKKVIFRVRCYDEGKAALRGMKGIQRIETGFHYLHETDTVYFDPKVITVEDMEAALKQAGTYLETMQEQGRN
jgi:copper chaperone CopZ